MRPRLHYIVFVLLYTAVIFTAASSAVSAQSINLTDNAVTSVGIELTPEHPGPGETVQAEIITTSIDLNRSDIGWFHNGELTASGSGLKTYRFTTGPAGSVTNIRVVIKAPNGILERQVTIRPASVDILWEANTAVPPFYKGKALYASLSKLRLAAVPDFIDENGQRVSPSKLIYTWRINDRVLAAVSGYGRQTAIITEPIYRTPVEFSVTVQTTEGGQTAESRIVIDETSPMIALYENHPSYGILFNRNLGNQFSMTGAEMKLEAFPFFFEVDRGADPTLTYQWFINGGLLSTYGGSSMTVRNETGARGTATLYVEVQNSQKIFESSTLNSSIYF